LDRRPDARDEFVEPIAGRRSLCRVAIERTIDQFQQRCGIVVAAKMARTSQGVAIDTCVIWHAADDDAVGDLTQRENVGSRRL
jgi:hypothetical protein